MFSHTVEQDNLAKLKKVLTEAIDFYLNDFNPPISVSLQDGNDFRFHYIKGRDGIERAKRYKQKVNSFNNEIELLTAVLDDLKKAHKVRQSEWMIAKAISFAQTLFSMPTTPEPSDLGSSEILATSLSARLCCFYNLKTYDNKTYQELTTIKKTLGEEYIAATPGREILALEEHLKTLIKAAEASRNPPSPEIDTDTLDADGWPKLN